MARTDKIIYSFENNGVEMELYKRDGELVFSVNGETYTPTKEDIADIHKLLGAYLKDGGLYIK